jgi:hypothetical protein
MKTRNELILEFMFAVAKHFDHMMVSPEENAKEIYANAVALADKYLENL